jgi:serine/threonine protein kinase, bacterial
MSLAVGEVFAGYTIVRRLGSGGMGEVYLAQHPRLPRRDALKLLSADWSADPEYRERFNREADLASTLWHPHIVGVHDRGECDGQLWISMDYVDGTDAARLSAERYPAGMPAEEVVAIVSAVASALDYAHGQGLLHRDVKPANIMLTGPTGGGERRILLTDFGIARTVEGISGLTATNMTVGTVAYCAPEQLLGEAIDGRADEYALAATAYHLLTGAQLFPHSNPAVVISRHLNTLPPALADTRPELAALDPVLAVGLAKNPEDRSPRCTDFAAALAESVDGTAAATPLPPTTPAPAPKRAAAAPAATPPAARARRWLVPAGVAAAILLAAGTAQLWRPWRHHATPTEAAPTAPPITASTTIISPTSATGAPPAPPTTTTTQPFPIALPACYRNDPITERPTVIHLACKNHWFEDLSWSMWSPSAADGTGMEMVKNCIPDCAGGQLFRNRVVLHFDAPAPAPMDSGCPASVRFYTQMIVAYPDAAAVPEFGPDTVGATKYNGMPALAQFEMEPAC